MFSYICWYCVPLLLEQEEGKAIEEKEEKVAGEQEKLPLDFPLILNALRTKGAKEGPFECIAKNNSDSWLNPAIYAIYKIKWNYCSKGEKSIYHLLMR